MLAKKAFALDLDWIISLGLFLIYLGAFFLFIRQTIVEPSPAESLLANVFDEITKSTSWSVQRLPLFITSNVSGQEPVIVNFNHNWKNFSFSDNTSFDIKDGKLIFIAGLVKGSNMLKLVNSEENYTRASPMRDLTAGKASASIDSQRMMAEFSDEILTRATHYEKVRLDAFNLSMEGSELKKERSETNITALSAKYKLFFPQINHTSIIIAGFPRIYNYVSSSSLEQHSLLASMTLRNYTHFHIDNELSGPINYSDECIARFGRFIDFNDGNSGLTLIGPEGTNISFCAGNNTIKLALQFNLGNETRYDLIFHAGDYTETLKYVSPFKTEFGITENITGMSIRLYQKLNSTGYDSLKADWAYPGSRDFSFFLTNTSGAPVFTYQPKNPGITDVFAKEVNVQVLDKYALKTRYLLRVKGW